VEGLIRSRKALASAGRGRLFATVAELQDALDKWVTGYNTAAAPVLRRAAAR
jgi:hypothetical protein